MEFARKTLIHYRHMGKNIVQLYLGMYIDVHSPLYIAVVRNNNVAMTLQNVTPELLPERVVATSQFTLPEYITDKDIINNISPTTAPELQSMLMKAFLLARNRKSGINQVIENHRDELVPLIQCSILGNYLHAKFPHPDYLSTPESRITALEEKTESMLKNQIDVVAAEYMAAMVPIYPYPSPPHNAKLNWQTLIKLAVCRADARIRGCQLDRNMASLKAVLGSKTSKKRKKGADNNNNNDDDEALQAQGCCFDYCFMETGHSTTHICPKCKGITAYAAVRPKRFKNINYPISHWQTRHDPRPTIICPSCDVRCIFVDLHGIMLCISRHFSIVACPGCDRPNVIEGQTPLKTAMCKLCIAANVKLSVRRMFMPADQSIDSAHVKCYCKNHFIRDTIHRQLVLSVDRKRVYSLPGCGYHHTKGVIKDDGYITAKPQKPITAKSRRGRKRKIAPESPTKGLDDSCDENAAEADSD